MPMFKSRLPFAAGSSISKLSLSSSHSIIFVMASAFPMIPGALAADGSAAAVAAAAAAAAASETDVTALIDKQQLYGEGVTGRPVATPKPRTWQLEDFFCLSQDRKKTI